VRLANVDPGSPVGTIAPVEVDGAPMAAIRTTQGWVLTPDRCPHAQCPFSEDGELADDGTLICNCHGSEFDPRSGALLLGPAQTGIAVTELKVERNTLNFEAR
jgi:3-phenylpropionate/trans-cinnamate dioxygenase ferredoxin component